MSGNTDGKLPGKKLPGKTESIPAGKFKTHCLRLMDEVQQSRGEIVVTKHGKPVAKLVPYEDEPTDVFGFMKGTVLEYEDIVGPTGEIWEADA